MGKEILAIPEEHLGEVAYIIRRGVEVTLGEAWDNTTPVVIEQLLKWCNEVDGYDCEAEKNDS